MKKHVLVTLHEDATKLGKSDVFKTSSYLASERAHASGKNQFTQRLLLIVS